MFGWANRWPSWPRATYSNQVLITSSCAANSPRNCQPFDRPFLRRSGHGAAPALHAAQRHAWVDLVAKTASSEGRYSPSMVRRAVSADTGYVQISTLTNFHRDWLDKKLRIMATRGTAQPILMEMPMRSKHPEKLPNPSIGRSSAVAGTGQPMPYTPCSATPKTRRVIYRVIYPRSPPRSDNG